MPPRKSDAGKAAAPPPVIEAASSSASEDERPKGKAREQDSVGIDVSHLEHTPFSVILCRRPLDCSESRSYVNEISPHQCYIYDLSISHIHTSVSRRLIFHLHDYV
jgi:hypothetical protein